MKLAYFILIVAITLGNAECHSQNTSKMQEQQNPLLCNPEIGMCEVPSAGTDAATSESNLAKEKPIKVIYYTDPICSSCWGIEPQLRKLKFEYGNDLEIEYRMGGLLPDWSYNSGGISKPSDVAHHWDDVSAYYDMPIDGDVWLEDPLHSSYPPSIAFKAAQMQDEEKAIVLLREIREMVFLKKKNITKWENLEAAAKSVGLDIAKFKSDYEGKANDLFNQDLQLGRELGVRGFPTMFFTDATGKKEMVYGSKPYGQYEAAILKLVPETEKVPYGKDWSYIFSKYPSLTAREFAELTGIDRNQSDKVLDELSEKGYLEKLTTKNGALWTLKAKK